MQIIVLSITNYKEKDVIISALSENGYRSFLLKGALAIKSRHAFLTNPLMIADISIMEGNYKFPIIKEAKEITSPLKINYDYYYLSAINLLVEITKKMTNDEEKNQLFYLLKDAIEALKNEINPYFICLTYLANILKLTGYNMEIDACVNCGNKRQIKDFSFQSGGFICTNCQTNENTIYSVKQLKLIRTIFKNKDFKIIDLDLNKSDYQLVLNGFYEFILEAYGIKLNSLNMLLK